MGKIHAWVQDAESQYMTDVPIKDAATVIILREMRAGPSVLMGQRGSKAVFMPGKFVFPGGAVDANDAQINVTGLPDQTAKRLAEESSLTPHSVAAAAVRELWEETGQILGATGTWDNPPQGWRGFAATGHIPAAPFEMFFRAVTPQGRPRRFDARFLLADADNLKTDPDDFSNAEDELSHLQWVALTDALDYDLPFITKVVLAELRAYVDGDRVVTSVPFFRNNDEDHHVSRIG